MTKLAIDADAFAQWHYKDDPTQMRFFSPNTVYSLVNGNGSEVDFVGNDVILLRKTQ
jgi:hypothetical protein